MMVRPEESYRLRHVFVCHLEISAFDRRTTGEKNMMYSEAHLNGLPVQTPSLMKCLELH